MDIDKKSSSFEVPQKAPERQAQSGLNLGIGMQLRVGLEQPSQATISVSYS